MIKKYGRNSTMRNECYTYFRITGRFDPDEITDLMELKPDRCWKIGDLRKKWDGIRVFGLVLQQMR